MHHRRGPWSQTEDATLLALVNVHGPHNWVRISQLVSSRSPKQCRERYHQNLKPTLNHDPITPEEGALIEQLVAEMGKRWAEIARRLHGRSDNAVKNWWNGGMNRRRRMCLRQRTGQSGDETPMEEEPASPGCAYSTVCSPSTEKFKPGFLSIDSSLVPRREDDDLLLPSPSFTVDYSRESRGVTPSLISDSTSNVSISPRLPPSPMSNTSNSLTLPPLINTQGPRRQSLPTLQPSDQHVPEFAAQTPSIYSQRRVDPASSRPSIDSGYHSVASSEAGSHYHYLRYKVPFFSRSSSSNSSSPKPEVKAQPKSPKPRKHTAPTGGPMQPDIRMNLASILG